MTQPQTLPLPAPPAPWWRLFYERHERAIALSAFVAGFVFDVLTLPRVDSWLAIAQQSLYIVLIAGILIHMLFEQAAPGTVATELSGTPSWYRRFRTVIVHFLFGSLLNLYTIYYFKSSSLLASFSFMTVLVVLLAANESPRFKALGLTFKFALLALCVLSFFAHVVPVFAGTIGPVVFVCSVLAGALLLAGAGWWAATRSPACATLVRSAIYAPLGLVLTTFLAFYLLKVIPPVPLSMPFIGIYHGVEKTDQGYRLAHERPGWRFWHNGDQEFAAQPGDRVYVYLSIFSPARFSERVLLRWSWKDETGRWVAQDTIPVNIVGGRAEGFRGYGYKSNYRPGEWRVQVETADAREIGRIHFRLTVAPAAERVFVTDIQ